MTRSAPAPAGAFGKAPRHGTRAPRTRFTESDEEAGIRGPCQSAMHTASLTQAASASDFPTRALICSAT
jgi:hypothetical protein